MNKTQKARRSYLFQGMLAGRPPMRLQQARVAWRIATLRVEHGDSERPAGVNQEILQLARSLQVAVNG